jgi:hypothetical protein
MARKRNCNRHILVMSPLVRVLAIGCSLLYFDETLADLLPDPDRASEPEVEV